ncbi:MAG TPA: ChbG/HpnK family deacetylase [Pirellulales bacterium]|nr:ChbG/HpnK family deacetylase [Pirellulales bacterium]
MSPRASIVFHADDLGMSPEVDDGIVLAFEQGLLTSTAVLANGPSAAEGLSRVQRASQRWCDHELPDATLRQAAGDARLPFDLGVHLNLTQGRPLTEGNYPDELLDAAGCFPGAGRLFAAVVAKGRRLAPAIEHELAAQIVFALDHGVRPTHINGHQYIELYPHVAQIVLRLIERFCIPVVRSAIERDLRHTTLRSRGAAAWALAHVKRFFAIRFGRQLRLRSIGHADGYFGTAHAGHVTYHALRQRVDAANQETLLEVGIHPGAAAPVLIGELRAADGWHDPLAALRPRECQLLCSARLADLLAVHCLRLGRLASRAT